MMNIEQIEERAKELKNEFDKKVDDIVHDFRKAIRISVAREIFEEIEEIAGRIDRNNMPCLRTLSETTIEKLKKKYESEKDDGNI